MPTNLSAERGVRQFEGRRAQVGCCLVQGFRHHRAHVPDPRLWTLGPRSPDWPPL